MTIRTLLLATALALTPLAAQAQNSVKFPPAMHGHWCLPADNEGAPAPQIYERGKCQDGITIKANSIKNMDFLEAWCNAIEITFDGGHFLVRYRCGSDEGTGPHHPFFLQQAMWLKQEYLIIQDRDGSLQ